MNATVAYALRCDLDYDPFRIPDETTWTDEYISLLHGMVNTHQPDEAFTKEDYLWVMAGLVMGHSDPPATQNQVRSLLRELNECSQVGLRVLVRDAASHVELPQLPNDRHVPREEGEPWPMARAFGCELTIDQQYFFMEPLSRR